MQKALCLGATRTDANDRVPIYESTETYRVISVDHGWITYNRNIQMKKRVTTCEKAQNEAMALCLTGLEEDRAL